MYRLIVYGEPVGQGRPRFARHGRFIQTYDPAKSKSYKEYVKLCASQNKPETPLEGPVSIHLDIYRPIPKSTSKKDRAQIAAGNLRPAKKPDIDNVYKAVTDALSGIWYHDDLQIVEMAAKKYYSEQPRVEISMETIEEANYAVHP
jgi:Holliday junction resolvase RusA-like endonuclease